MPVNKIIYKENEKIGDCFYLKEVGIKNKSRYAIFKCKCGNKFTTTITKVKIGHTKSCGCLHKEGLIKRNTKHGLRHLSEYSLWLNMKQRCTNEKYYAFKHWGGRGITVCDRWLNSFENFYQDMGSQPEKRMGIDRIDNNKGYYKENCRWATPKEQCNNKRNNRFIEYNGKCQTLAQWCNELGLKYRLISHRFLRGGKTIEEIFTVKKYNTNGSPIL